MELDKILENKDVDYLKKEQLIDESDVLTIENELGVKLGEQLKKYLFKYGYLGYKYVEFCGINKKILLNSSMIKETKYIHEKDEIFEKYIVVLNIDSHEFYLVDSKDRVFRLIIEADIIKFEYTKLYFNDFVNQYLRDVDSI